MSSWLREKQLRGNPPSGRQTSSTHRAPPALRWYDEPREILDGHDVGSFSRYGVQEHKLSGSAQEDGLSRKRVFGRHCLAGRQPELDKLSAAGLDPIGASFRVHLCEGHSIDNHKKNRCCCSASGAARK